jgi:serine/threonine-protein kinase RsbT
MTWKTVSTSWADVSERTVSVTGDTLTIPIEGDADIVAARMQGRQLAKQVGFTGTDLVLIATAISEITRNIVSYATRGEMTLTTVTEGSRRGITFVIRDQGPGIDDIPRAMRDGFSTGRSLGLGLPGARRLMDDFQIASLVGQGTTVTMSKWLR